MDKVTIADNLFLQYGKSAFLGQDNAQVDPTYIEWELASSDKARFVTDSFIKDAHGKGQVAWLLEPFLMHPENYYAAMEKSFDYVLTCNRYFADNFGWLWYAHGGSWIDLLKWKAYPKEKNISIVLSNKKSMPGHKLRHEIVSRFADKFDDVLGLCEQVEMFDGLSRYRFSVVIENEKAPGYFTEKLIDCLSVGTIPIYWGAHDIGLYFETDGIIPINNIEEIPAALEFATPAFYKSKLPVIKKNIVLATNYCITEDWICQEYPFLFR